MDVPLSSVTVPQPLASIAVSRRSRPQHAMLSTLTSTERFGQGAKEALAVSSSKHLPPVDHSRKAKEEKTRRDRGHVEAREKARAARENFTYAEMKFILPQKEAHHDKKLKARKLLARFPAGLHTSIVMRDEHVATLPDDMSYLNHITRIDVAGNNMREISPGVMQLPSLTELDVSNNYVESLPTTLTCLSRLTILRLRYNRLGSLPELYGMGSLERLDASHNLLESLPESISELKHLITLDVRNCHLRVLPDAINDLRSNLREVLADFNYLVSIPRRLGNMQALRHLSLTQNLLRDLRPGCLEALTCLEHLQMNHNRIAEMPRTIGLMHGLTSLIFSSNALTEAPKSLAAITSLVHLDLSNNRIAQLPVLSSLASLSTLMVAHNSLTELPMGLHKISTLGALDARGNPDLKCPPVNVALMGLTHIVQYLEAEDGRRILKSLGDKKIRGVMEVFVKRFKREREMEEGFRLLDNGTGQISASEFGVWTRVVGLTSLRPHEVRLLYSVLDDDTEGSGTVPRQAVMDTYRRFKAMLEEEGRTEAREGTKQWLEEQRQYLVDLEMEEALAEAEKAKALTIAKMKARRREQARRKREEREREEAERPQTLTIE
uniref:EF-hand domain-containing protein n=1 Tax=Hemiselmis tepida TaxID=464990 RepID=A0A7S0Z4L0_9CRYP|mmetsp:Transcript_35975/g.91965  ORF Transcript_35975/g.91965 Transcript_35975/m.91965 type:complete len:608 (+) Transcript_35975:121-1944(+)